MGCMMSEQNDRRMAEFLIRVARLDAKQFESIRNSDTIDDMATCRRLLTAIEKTSRHVMVKTYRYQSAIGMAKYVNEHKRAINKRFEEALANAQIKLV